MNNIITTICTQQLGDWKWGGLKNNLIVVRPQLIFLRRNNNTHSQCAQFSRSPYMIGQLVSHDILLGRWRFALDLFGRVFCDDVGMESGSVISELGGFPVKESKFRREMEKIRNPQQRDLTLEVGGATGAEALSPVQAVQRS